MASQNGTYLYLDGALLNPSPMVKGAFFEALISGAGMITSNNRVLVMQYSNSTMFDSTTGDPFMMIIEPVEQYLDNYTVGTPQSGFSANYLNITAPDAAAGLLSVDGSVIPAGSFISIASSGFSATRVSVGVGSHNIISPLPIGVNVYGFDDQDGYGYPGGSGMTDFVSTSTATVTPTRTPTGTRTATRTATSPNSPTFTRTPTYTQTQTPGDTLTETPSYTVTHTETLLPTRTVTLTNSVTQTLTPSQTMTTTFSITPTMTVSDTITKTQTMTFTPTKTITRTITPTLTFTKTITATPTRTVTSTPQASATVTPVTPRLQLILKGNYNDPFAEDTNIVYWLSRDAEVCVRVFTVSGEIVIEECGINAKAGHNNFHWDGKNRAKRHIASGTFIYSVTAQIETGEKAQGFEKLVCVR